MRNISNFEVSCSKFSHWAILLPMPDPFRRVHHSLHPHTNCTLCIPRCARYVWILCQENNKVPGLETEKFATVLSLFLFPVLCFLITCVTLLTTSLFGYYVIPWTTKIISRKKHDILAWYLIGYSLIIGLLYGYEQ